MVRQMVQTCFRLLLPKLATSMGISSSATSCLRSNLNETRKIPRPVKVVECLTVWILKLRLNQLVLIVGGHT